MSPAPTQVMRRWPSMADVDDEIAAGHLGDAACSPRARGCRRGMPQSALGCSRNFGPCQILTVSRAAMPGQMTLRPPRIPGHQVRLDQAGGDLQIGVEIASSM